MSRDRKLVVALLGVVVVLLSLSLGRAMGQGQPDPPGAPDAPVVPVAMHVDRITTGNRQYRVFRMWSDGSVDTTLLVFEVGPFPGSPGCDIQTSCTVDVPID